MSNTRFKIPTIITDYLGMATALVGLLIIFGSTTENFLTKNNFIMIANQSADITIMAVGMTFVLIIAGIDLSVGSVMALSGATLGVLLYKLNVPWPLAILACPIVGLLCGIANGVIITQWKLPSFIVTLGMLEVARGATYILTGSDTLYVSDKLAFFTDITFFGLTIPVYAALTIVIIAQFVLSKTVFGRYMVAVGTNEEALRLSGINPRPIKIAVFVICALLASLAAIIYTARYQANPNNGVGLELQVIAAVVIGGTSLMGGRGSVITTFLGVLIIRILGTGLAQADAQEHTKRLITGCVIVAAVILDHYRQRIRKAKAE